jgi:hypothetical protein
MLTRPLQAATGLESLKMGESPAKNLDFGAVGKENVATDVDFLKPIESLKTVDAPIKPVEVPVDEKRTAIAPTIKDDEADEPLLMENPHRFVMFPIKYHEVSPGPNAYYQLIPRIHDQRWRDRASINAYRRVNPPLTRRRSGRCTRRPKPRSGRPRRSICPRTFTIGTTA